jgi:hypothetical protein
MANYTDTCRVCGVDIDTGGDPICSWCKPNAYTYANITRNPDIMPQGASHALTPEILRAGFEIMKKQIGRS